MTKRQKNYIEFTIVSWTIISYSSSFIDQFDLLKHRKKDLLNFNIPTKYSMNNLIFVLHFLEKKTQTQMIMVDRSHRIISHCHFLY